MNIEFKIHLENHIRAGYIILQMSFKWYPLLKCLFLMCVKVFQNYKITEINNPKV